MTSEEPDSIDDSLADDAAELIQETNAEYEERRREQEEFLDTVSEEEGHEVLETQCTLIDGYTVTLEAKLNGEVMDRLGNIQARIERLEEADPEDKRVYDMGDAADEASQLLADLVAESEYDKALFYEVYRRENLVVLGELLSRAFEALKEERERREGVSDGFRSKPDGA